MSEETDSGPDLPGRARADALGRWFVLVVGTIACLFAAHRTRSEIVEDQSRRSEELAVGAQAEFVGAMGEMSHVLAGARGLFVASQEVTPEEWASWARGYALERRLPAVQGVGFLPRSHEWHTNPGAHDLSGVTATLWQPTGSETLAVSPRIVYALLHSELCCSSDDPILLSKADGEPLATLFLPVCRSSAGQEAEELGIVFLLFDPRQLLETSLAPQSLEALATVDDITDPDHPIPFVRRDAVAPRALRQRTTVEAVGRIWSMGFVAPRSHAATRDRLAPFVVFGISLVAVLLLFSNMTSLHTMREQAVDLARLRAARLNEREQEHASVVSVLDEGILQLDPAERIVAANDAARRLLGGELQGRTLSALDLRFCQEQGKPLAGFEIVAAMRAEDAARLHRRVVRIERADGSQIWASISGRPLPSGTVLTISDVSEEHRAMEHLAQARDRAEEASRSKSTFLANMSHELRTPLNAIIGLTDLMRDDAVTGEQIDHLLLVRRAADSLLLLLSDVMDFAQAQSGKLEVAPRPYVLRDELAPVHGLISERAESKGLSLRWEIADDVPSSVTGDPARLRQVLLNLLSNAVKFTPRGRVSFSVRHDQVDDAPTLEIQVADTGIGIPAELLSKVFEPFAQADESHTRRFGGTGIGLTLSSEIVRLMGGKIWLESEPQRGTIVRITLPVEASDAVGPARAA
ncbi:MAG: PAS domain S-box protein [Candidatus Eisenbacteria bacterium]|nr:PAS domain S-box protein [Candidatus Eisenbacteria bacterium]